MPIQAFVLNPDFSIDAVGDSAIITVDKGDAVEFELTNNSGVPLLDWGLYFNNPFDVTNSCRYSFGQQAADTNVYRTSKTVSNDENVPMYNAYAIYCVVGEPGQTQHIYQKDPEIIVRNGDVTN